MSPEHDTDAHELLLLSTEQLTQAYDLRHIERIRIGRHHSNQLQLTSRTVSNFHAEIVDDDGTLVLRDLGSTNGTLLNGRNVQEEKLSTGDQILIGNHAVRLDLKARSDAASSRPRRKAPGRWMPGHHGRVLNSYSGGFDGLKTLRVSEPGDAYLVELIRELAAAPGSLKAVIEHDRARAAIYFHQQQIRHVELGPAVGEKALYQIFRWQEASYSIGSFEQPDSLPCTIALPVETLLAEGTEQALEIGRLVGQLPPFAASLRLNPDCPIPLTSHTPAEIEIFQAIIRHETIERVLESSPFTDVRILRLVDALLRKGVFELNAAVSADSGMEETRNYQSHRDGESS